MSSSESDESSGKVTSRANSTSSWRDCADEQKKNRARSRRLSTASVQSLPCGSVATRRASQNRICQIKLEERKNVSRETDHERSMLRCAHLSASCDELCLDCIAVPSEPGATTPNGAANCMFSLDADGDGEADDDSVSSALSTSTSFASAESFVRRSRSLSFASRSVSPSIASCSSPVRVGIASGSFGLSQSPTGSGRVPSPFASQMGSRLSVSSRREQSPFQGGLVALAPSSLISSRGEPSSLSFTPGSSGNKCYSPGASQYSFLPGAPIASPYSPSQLHPPSPLTAALPPRPAAVSSPSQPATPSRSASPSSSGYLSSHSTNVPQASAINQGCSGPLNTLPAAAGQRSPSAHRYRTHSNSVTIPPSRLDDVVSARRITLKRKFDELVAMASANPEGDLNIASRIDSVPQSSPTDASDSSNANSSSGHLLVGSMSETDRCDIDTEPITTSDCAIKDSGDDLLLMVAPSGLLDAQDGLDQDHSGSESQCDAKRCRKTIAD